MIRLKTGALAALAAYTGMRAAGKEHEESNVFAALFAEAGIGFQILDDAKNISTGNAGKKRGDDIVEGKKSMPAILHIEKHPEDAAALTAYFEQARREGIDSPAIEKAIALLSSSDSIADAEAQGKKTIDLALEQPLQFPHTVQGLFFTCIHGRQQADNHRQNKRSGGDYIQFGRI